jgi:hypothetical protein
VKVINDNLLKIASGLSEIGEHQKAASLAQEQQAAAALKAYLSELECREVVAAVRWDDPQRMGECDTKINETIIDNIKAAVRARLEEEFPSVPYTPSFGALLLPGVKKKVSKYLSAVRTTMRSTVGSYMTAHNDISSGMVNLESLDEVPAHDRHAQDPESPAAKAALAKVLVADYDSKQTTNSLLECPENKKQAFGQALSALGHRAWVAREPASSLPGWLVQRLHLVNKSAPLPEGAFDAHAVAEEEEEGDEAVENAGQGQPPIA